ncbi:MAG: hypothetical protein IT229_04850 [Flavobacteriales bacterium]|nr:hypothetical protein [Flavobacteriales bacterium]
MIRTTEEEKEAQIRTVANVQQAYAEEGKGALRTVQAASPDLFRKQLTQVMFEVGGQYRRNM